MTEWLAQSQANFGPTAEKSPKIRLLSIIGDENTGRLIATSKR
jgi:hypothetical protein